MTSSTGSTGGLHDMKITFCHPIRLATARLLVVDSTARRIRLTIHCKMIYSKATEVFVQRDKPKRGSFLGLFIADISLII
jgi:hypothetical protein